MREATTEAGGAYGFRPLRSCAGWRGYLPIVCHSANVPSERASGVSRKTAPIPRGAAVRLFGRNPLQRTLSQETAEVQFWNRSCGPAETPGEAKACNSLCQEVVDVTIEQRIDRLEQQNRRLKVAALALVVVVPGCAFLAGSHSPQQAKAHAASTPAIVEAREFRMVDDFGETRASLYMDAMGNPVLSLTGRLGSRASLYMDTMGRPTLSLDSVRGRILLIVDQLGPALLCYDWLRQLRAGLRVGIREGYKYPALYLYDAAERSYTRLGMGEYGPILEFIDEDGMARAGLGIGKDGPTLLLTDPNGNVIWSAP